MASLAFPMFGDSGGSSNQFFPTLPNLSVPGQSSTSSTGGFNFGGNNSGVGVNVPPAQPIGPRTAWSGQRQPRGWTGLGSATGTGVPAAGMPGNLSPGSSPLGEGTFAEGPLSPGFTTQWLRMLSEQMGLGVTPFNLQTQLPWETTAPGQLNADLNPLYGNLINYFNQGPEGQWAQMIAAMQRPIQQGAANLAEQFNVGIGLAGSPFGTAATDYQNQAALQQNALLAQMMPQFISQEQQFATGLQQIGQQDIQNMYNEFIRTQPQYNPLLQYMGQGATTFPPMFNKQSVGGGVGGALAANSGPALAALLPLLMGLCWVAASFYGWDNWRTYKIRSWILNQAPKWFRRLYITHGQWIAKTPLRWLFRPIFEVIIHV